MKPLRFCISLLALLLLLPLAAPRAQDLKQGENFLVPLPDDYKQVLGRESPKHMIAHYIPQEQKDDDWVDKIIVQIFRGVSIDPAAYIQQMRGGPITGCLQFSSTEPLNDTHNGYPSARITLVCTLGSDSGMGSVAMLRVYGGNDAFYYVQRIWRGAPFDASEVPVSDGTLQEWAAFLDAVVVCDTNRADHPCMQ